MIIKRDPLKALSDPLRIQLFELIKEGPKTTPELAKILKKDRMDLYHHLKILEQAGLIKSSYNSKRMKIFVAQSNAPEINHQQQSTLILPDENPKEKLGMIILSPPKDRVEYHQFRLLLDQVAELCGSKIPLQFEILQVQVATEDKSASEEKYRQLSRMKRSKSKSM